MIKHDLIKHGRFAKTIEKIGHKWKNKAPLLKEKCGTNRHNMVLFEIGPDTDTKKEREKERDRLDIFVYIQRERELERERNGWPRF